MVSAEQKEYAEVFDYSRGLLKRAVSSQTIRTDNLMELDFAKG